MKKAEGPRTLLVDTETFPMLFFAWQPWEATALRVVENTSFACWSAKWLGGKQITRCLADYAGYKPNSRNDKKLLAELWKLLDEADIVVAHNAKKFDVKKINYRFIVHGLGIPSPYQIIDTLTEVRKVASFDSHRLNELSRLTTKRQKLRTGGADLWFDCLEGDEKAWRHMKRYCANDVAPLLEDWYLTLRPWIKSHPNVGMWSAGEVCPKCGSDRVQARGTARNNTTAYRRMHCQSCGGWSRSAKSIPKRKPLVSA